MAYRYGDRYQMALFPQSIEEYVSKDDPVRAYDAFVEALDTKELGVILHDNKAGNPEYNPKSMIKLLLYGYSYGFRSSRKLERATYHNLSFIWIMGGLKPDHKTIANFRRKNRNVLKDILKQCARMCIELDLIDGNTLFIDSTKIRANASIKNTYTIEKGQRHLERINERIEKILTECERIDKQEENNASLIKLKGRLKQQELLKAKIEKVVKELKEEKKKSINTVDRDSTKINFPARTHAGYNAHIAADEKNGLIVSNDVLSENDEKNQFANQVNIANKTLGKKCATACADAGYAHTEELKKIHDQNIRVIVPSQKQALKNPPKEPNPFDKTNFIYDAKNDCYICPEGHTLPYSRTDERWGSRCYMITRNAKATPCKQCRHFGKCTKAKEGRKITRLQYEELKEELEALYEEPESQSVYALRKEKAELPFAHIKRNLGVQAFLLRGLDGVKAEMSLFASCFNISRMITLLGGVSGLIKRFASQKEVKITAHAPLAGASA